MVTSQKEQIQSLIADIERALGAQKPRTPWVKASEIEPQRQALARAQTYLMSLEQMFEVPGGWGPVDPNTGRLDAQVDNALAGRSPYQTLDQSLGSSSAAASVQAKGRSVESVSADSASASSPVDSAAVKSAEDLLRELRTEMRFLKSSALEPLRLEIDRLQSAREVLQQEVETLEEQRSQVSQTLAEQLAEQTNERQAAEARNQEARNQEVRQEIAEAQLNQFLSALMERLQENLSTQVTQTLVQMESDHAAAIAAIKATTESDRLALQPSREAQLEKMQQLQSRSDQLLVEIDSTLQQAFQTLQSNISGYQTSLSEEIETTHSLGRQSEEEMRSLWQQMFETLQSNISGYQTSLSEEIETTHSLSRQGEEEVRSLLQQMFETLQSNISGYQTSLNEGLETMHSLGRQGEGSVRLLSEELETMHSLGRQGEGTVRSLSEEIETLQSNINDYQASLSEELETMQSLSHRGEGVVRSLREEIETVKSLGRQGEEVMRSLVERLTTQLDQLDQTTASMPATSPPATSSNDASSDTSVLPITELDDAELDELMDELSDDLFTDDLSMPEPEPAARTAPEQEFDLEEAGSEEVDSEESDTEAADVEENSQPEMAAEDTEALLVAASPARDTVNSLDEILPGEPNVNELNADELDPEASDIDPTTFIREDGTIDVDLLKLDVDRSDQSAPVPDEIMVDAAIADAQIAEAETEDPEIEAKVMPTADATFLAGLTIDDLTIDDLAVDDELTAAKVPADDLLPPAMEATNDSDQSSETALGTNSAEAQSAIDTYEAENDVELAAVLPDLGPLLPSVAIPAMSPSEDVLEEPASEETVSEDISNNEDDEHVNAEEIAPEERALEESYLGLESLEEEHDSAEDEYMNATRVTEPATVIAESGVEEPTVDTSQLVEDSESFSLNSPDAEETQDDMFLPNSSDTALSEGLPEELSEDLLDTLEEDNQASIRNAIDQMSSVDTDELVPDLEEPTVSYLSEDALISRATSITTSLEPAPLESALIPDEPNNELTDTDDLADEPIDEEISRSDRIEQSGETNQLNEIGLAEEPGVEEPNTEGLNNETNDITEVVEPEDGSGQVDSQQVDSQVESYSAEEAPVNASTFFEEHDFEERGFEEHQESQSVEVLESSLTPDIIDTDEEVPDQLPLLEESDTALSDELQNALEEDNQASIRNALEAPAVAEDELVPDLEEPTVSELSEDVFVSRSSSPIASESLESALIPDEPNPDEPIPDEPIPDEPIPDEPIPDEPILDELSGAVDAADLDTADLDIAALESDSDDLESMAIAADQPAAVSAEVSTESSNTESSTESSDTESSDTVMPMLVDEPAEEVSDEETPIEAMFDEELPVVEMFDEEVPVGEMPIEALFIEDSAFEGLSVEGLPSTGVTELLADDMELLTTLGQPETDSPVPLFDDDLDFFDMSQSVEDRPAENQPAEEPSAADSMTTVTEVSPSTSLENESESSEESAIPLEEDRAISQLTASAEPPAELPSAVPATALLVDPPIDPIDSPEQPDSSPQSDSSQPPSIELSDLADAAELASVESAQTTVKETALQPIDHEGLTFDDEDRPTNWFLSIDLGTTGISAVLMERRTHRMYELCWSVAGDREAKRFRLPAVAAVNTQGPTGQLGIGVVGPAALQQEDMPLLRSLKPMVKTGIPDDVSGEPWMQWSDQMSLPLLSLQTAICDLLRTLSPSHMSCHAVGLKDTVLRRALANLQSVIIGYPTNWPDTYSFNIREAVLSTKLVARPDQIFFVEDAIAALLSALPMPGVDVSSDNQQPGLYNCNWSGGTVIVSAGAALTEVAIADLPKDLTQLSYADFTSRSYTYAGDGIDQDIICQLLHLPIQNEAREDESSAQFSANDWESLKLDQLQLPRPGEADRIIRHRLYQRLNDSSLGRQALAAAQDLKMMLQEDEEVDVQLGDRTWIITRKDLEAKVFAPYIQRIDRLTRALFDQKPLSPQSIKQVICTGGAASLGTISDWLRQKFPNATIIQDTYAGEYSNSCSRVAYGLANLCHYPAVLDTTRHRYNDYFLLLELLRTLPEQPLPAGGIMHLLAQRGVDIPACQAHLLALIEGRLPPGLVPTEGDRPLVSAQTSDIENYRLLAELPLLRKQGGQIYVADFEQGERLRSHLESLLSTKAQSLDKPMTADSLTAQTEIESVEKRQ
ncbi:hypothetical protein [cf. Phormidesmis sp. LEGE 11477]|uniref:hypothetical protein n=1 Tax=cf. Phormidesmis sp. LEGE 11477 TaxID=1828680 RepID=UPI00187E9C57|nr:hypothetical protein [cf. Phormidesmis sp. LEGE 11477]MBE9062184.1 hypothetical protein [cf. Phormidesmis sp. LEGE 11477]